ncbi:MAG TPA: pyridoxamine 5'-phosphate oxidase [Fimbriimonas sp.]|nr:pyridoxamine 5'-phosphate oxidase [Fimbriimonas sp.]
MSDHIRRYDYNKGTLKRSDLDDDPFVVLNQWLEQAVDAEVIEPTAMVLSTVAASGAPSSRVVLLRSVSGEGLVFFTNYLSRKGSELGDNPHACVNFWWGALERQIRVEGTVRKVSKDVSDAYFASRPITSQAASAASPQSRPIENSDILRNTMRDLLAEGSIERPEHWGGYLLEPNYFEFWQGGAARLHDRFAYSLAGDSWSIQQLAP